VLFADLKGSTELLADRDPEEARQLLDPVIERMMEAVHRHEGTVNQVMGDGIMALEPILPPLLALLDVPVDDPSWPALDPSQRRQRTFDAVKRLLLREAREQLLLVVLEDLHRIDSETQALLDGVVESLGSARLLLLIYYRPEYRHTWSGKTSYSQTRLEGGTVRPCARARCSRPCGHIGAPIPIRAQLMRSS